MRSFQFLNSVIFHLDYLFKNYSIKTIERSQIMPQQIILSDFDIEYPPLSSLPKEQGSFVLLRLSQYPMKDKDTKTIIDGEFTNCCFTTAFGKQTGLLLPNGERLTLTVSTWKRNQDGNITNPTKREQLTDWFDDSENDKLLYMIENKIFYLYGDLNNPESDRMLPDTYKEHIQKLNSQTMVMPTEQRATAQTNQELIGG